VPASCRVTVNKRDGSEPLVTGVDVTVAFGASANATNTNIQSAVISRVQTENGVAANQGGTDRTSLFGGRAL
jgi:hypothetical protein